MNRLGLRFRRAALLASILATFFCVPCTPCPSDPPEEGGYGELLWKGPGGLVAMPVVSTNVELSATGMMVRGTVFQEFENSTGEVIEAVYVFPLPEGAAVDGMEMNDLRARADIVRDREKSCIVVLGSVKDDKASLLVAVTKDLAGRFPANELIKPLAAIIGGTGGGRPEMAQAGGKLTHEMDRALAQAFSEVERKANG